MTEAINEKRRWRDRSPLRLVLSAIVFSVLTYALMNIYAIAHWGILPQTTSLKHDLNELRNITVNNNIVLEKDSRGRDIINRMEKDIFRIEKSGWKYMNRGNLYHITGFVAFGFAVAAFFRKPLWIAFIGLPFGLIGVAMGLSIM